MFIPRGEKGKPANRFPFLTYAVIAFALLHYALLRSDTLAALGEFQVALGEVIEYAMSDQKLMLDSRLAEYLQGEDDDSSALDERFEDVIEEDTEERANEFASVRRPGQRSLKQAKLDQMTDVALEILLTHPGYAKGYSVASHDASRLMTHLFTYFHLPTLIGSLLFLALVGGFVEAIWGRIFWLVCFLGGGILNALVYLQFDTSGQFLFGFSGGLMALLGAFTVRYALKWVYFSFLVISLTLPGVAVTLLALAWDFLLPTVESFGYPPFNSVTTPYVSHAVVFGFGLLLGVAVRVLNLEAKINPFDESEESIAVNAVIQNALHAKKSGKIDYAYELLQKETRKHPNSVELLLAFWDVAVAAQKAEQTVPRMLQLIRDRLRANAASEAIEYWKVVATGHPEVSAEPKLFAQLALLLGKDNREIAGFTLRRFFDKPGADLTPKLATRLCRLAREIDCMIPVEVAEVAVSGNDPEADDRAYLENLVAAARGVVRMQPTVQPEDIVGSRAIDATELAPSGSRSTRQRVEVLDETAIETPVNVEDLLSTFEDTLTDAAPSSPESVSPLGFSAKDLAGLDSGANLEELVLPDFDTPLSGEPEEGGLAPAPPSLNLDMGAEGSLFDDQPAAPPTQKSVERSAPLVAPSAVGVAEDFGAFDPSDIALDALQSDASLPSAVREPGSFAVEDFDTSALDPSQLLAESVADSTPKSVGSGHAFDAEAIDATAFDPEALNAELGSAGSSDFAAEPGMFDPDALAAATPPAAATAPASVAAESVAASARSTPPTAASPPSAAKPPVASPTPRPTPAAVPQPAPAAVSRASASPPEATPDSSFDDVDLSGLFGDEALPQLRRLAVQEYAPLAIEAAGMLLRSADGTKQRILVSNVQAVALVAVRGLSEKPVVLIDILLNWRAAKTEPLQVIRLRSDRFNPKTLRPEESSPLHALRKVVADLVQNAQAMPLPGPEIFEAAQPKIFASLEQYHAEVLNAR